MTNSARFHSAVSTTRPRGARVIESYSPKLGRRLQCFNENAFRQWICLEADPSIEIFCERPALLTLGDDKRMADFWTRQRERETFLIIDEKSQPTTVTVHDTELPVRTIHPVELAAVRVWTDNWERMLPAIISCRQLISPSLLQSILQLVSEPMELSRIERELVRTSDVALVRAAVFTLLHRGQLQAPPLHTAPLSFLTCFQPVRPAP